MTMCPPRSGTQHIATEIRMSCRSSYAAVSGDIRPEWIQSRIFDVPGLDSCYILRPAVCQSPGLRRLDNPAFQQTLELWTLSAYTQYTQCVSMHNATGINKIELNTVIGIVKLFKKRITWAIALSSHKYTVQIWQTPKWYCSKVLEAGDPFKFPVADRTDVQWVFSRLAVPSTVSSKLIRWAVTTIIVVWRRQGSWVTWRPGIRINFCQRKPSWTEIAVKSLRKGVD